MNQVKIKPKQKNLAEWYDSVLQNAQLVQPSAIKGMFMILPRAWAIWEQIQQFINQEYQLLGVSNVAFPTILPTSDLAKEKQHLKGFEPELFLIASKKNSSAWTLRPTSETAFCHYLKHNVNSYHDLPIKLNQWCNVFRVEKNTKAFLRTCEFHWQELHTAHASEQEAQAMVATEFQIYQKCLKQLLNIACLSGPKSINEKFAGAKETYTLEVYLPDGQMLQSCTAHYLGQNFAQAFDLKFTNHHNQKSLMYQTSAGLSTRILGALIMTHGDDHGLVLPFAVAPVQITIIDIAKNHNQQYYQTINLIKQTLIGYRYTIDQRNKSFGYKIQEHEMAGTPFIIVIGDQEVQQQIMTLIPRNTRIKQQITGDQLKNQFTTWIAQYGDYLLQQSYNRLKTAIVPCQTWKEVLQTIEQKKIALAPWFNDPENEAQFQKTHKGFSIRCLATQQLINNQQCVFSQKPANCYVYFARSY